MRKTTVQLEPMSYAMTEEMKTLRTNILFCGNDKKVITVTSCVMGEGKTKISIRLATSLVELKKRVLLMLVGGNCGGTLGAIFFNDEKYEFTHVFDLGLYP